MATNNDYFFWIFDITTGAPKTGEQPNIAWTYLRNADTGEDYGSKPAFAEVDAANMPGLYKFVRPNEPTMRLIGLIDLGPNSQDPYELFDQRGEELIDAVNVLGTPAGASVSADVAGVKSDTAAIKAKTDNLPADPAATSDVSSVYNRLGAPAGASTAADIAAVKTVVDAVKAKTDFIPADLDDMVARLLGLAHENSVLDNTSYDSLNNLTAGRLRIYDSKANAQAAGATGLLATYSVTATYSAGNLATYTVVKEP